MAFDEAYNEPENVEVLVKSLDPGQPAQLHYAHAGDAGADLRTTEEVTLKPFQRALVPTGVAIACRLCGAGASAFGTRRQAGRHGA